MKKTVLMIVALCICASMNSYGIGKGLKLIKDEGGTEYIKKTYGAGFPFVKAFNISVISKKEFERVKQQDREAVISDRSQSDIIQKKKVDEIDARQWQENRFFSIFIISDKQLMNSDLRFGLEIRTAKGVNIADKARGIHIVESSGKSEFKSQNKYGYKLYFSSTKPLTKDFFSKDELPGQLWFQFPDNSTLVYSIE